MKEQNGPETIFIVCCDCGSSFPFEPGEQRFYSERSLNLPRRCPSCRLARKIKLLQKQTPSWGSRQGEVG